MFTQSYDPFCGNLRPPRARDARKRREQARHLRMAESERRRRAELERIQRMVEKLKTEEHRRRTETREWLLEEEELHGESAGIHAKQDGAGGKVARSQSSMEDCNPSGDSAAFPPRSIVLNPGVRSTAPGPKSNHRRTQSSDSSLSSNCTEEHRQDANIVCNNNDSSPPHIIAGGDVSDDEEDENLDSIWMDQTEDPGPSRLVSYEGAECQPEQLWQK